jgi:cytidyltransferase-like protein
MALTAMPKCSSQPPVIEGRRIGVFGGTFDPIHIGHLVIAEEARVRLALAQVLFVPARVSPLKLPGTFFSAEDRLAMVELAIADNPGFAARASISTGRGHRSPWTRCAGCERPVPHRINSISSWAPIRCPCSIAGARPQRSSAWRVSWPSVALALAWTWPLWSPASPASPRPLT